MTRTAQDLVSSFFAAMPAGNLAAELFAPDLEARSITSPGAASAERYIAGIRLLQSLFPKGLHYTIDAITAEDDRAAAEVRGLGIFANGDVYSNTYVFMFRFRDGKIASMFEFFDPKPINEMIMPRLAEALAKMPG